MKRLVATVLISIAATVAVPAMHHDAAAAPDCASMTFQQGSTGDCVKTIQTRLNFYGCAAGPVDGSFGSVTAGAVKRFQTANQLTVDGVVTPTVWGVLVGSTARPCGSTPSDCASMTFQQGSTGDCVKTIQTRLNFYGCAAGPVDGSFGSVTAGAVKRFQTANQLTADGVVTPNVWGVLVGSTARACSSTVNADDDAADRKLCQQSAARCILVHRVAGVNTLELYENKAMVASVVVNTGPSGMRTRNTTSRYIYDETFSTESSETVTSASFGVDPKKWAPGVRQVFDQATTGLMGDPHRFDGGLSFHWRVQYSASTDENGKSIPVLVNGLAQERNEYFGGYVGNGCVHVPKWFLDAYDATFFQRNVLVRIQDQPTS